MSNFPIIRTTPPPMDIIDSEEEEPDFGAFNGVTTEEEEEDIDFIVPVIKQNNGKHLVNNNNNAINANNKKPSVDDNECNHMTADEDNSITIESNTCDDNSIKSTEQDINDLNSEEYNHNTSEHDMKELELESLPDIDSNEHNLDKHLEESEDNKEVTEEDKEVVEELNVTEIGVTDDDLEFADFASFQFTECESNCNQINDSIAEGEDDNNSFSFYKSKSFSEMSFTDCVTNVDNNFNAIKSPQTGENESDIKDTESDDDFADFASAQPVLNTNLESVPDLKTNTSDSTPIVESDGEFADFSSFQTNNTINGFTEHVNLDVIPQSVPNSDELTQLFAQIFPKEETISSDENTQNISRDLFNTCDENSNNLWKSLQDLESAPSLKLRWPNSHSFQLLLTSLNIDPRNILRNSSVPVFASGLGLVLEPTKHLFNNNDITDENETISESSTTSSIPPVQFDWVSSGLTNPLDVNQKSTAAFDLDFFVTNDDVKNTKKQTNFSDIDDFLNDKNGNHYENVAKISDSNKTNLMQQILSSVSNTSSVTNLNTDSNQTLSAEAIQVLDELPNLSFMRAKVLMFPISSIKSQANS
ncbi:unnamed protein product [Medioppia subpectinata]|uniref:Aftiphilin clathrin-binding box domain-containing protein n=1 Tax=Medioppia subpectinata TaxID=1979941 RepID=A0A7R9KCC1_9ACAR|nr:unnamed protein product [Medioppia subpectinata]CAG2100489.1 unnamed protein product [Medioppia subpectinata]